MQYVYILRIELVGVYFFNWIHGIEKYFCVILPQVGESTDTQYCFPQIVRPFKGPAGPVYYLDVCISEVSEARIGFIYMNNVEELTKILLKREVIYFPEN